MTPSDIEEAHELDLQATRGPWAFDLGRFSNRVVTSSGEDIADVGTPADARFVARSRTGWPAAVAAWRAALAQVADVRIEAERAANDAATRLHAAEERATAAVAARNHAEDKAARATAAVEVMQRRLEAVELELARLRPLPDAIARFLRHRYNPEFVASWNAYLASCKE